VADLVQPAQGTTFVQHLHTADWQHGQYRLLKEKLLPGQLLLVEDYAENRKSKMQDEIKSAHWCKQQFSLFPIVGFYRDETGQLIRHAVDFVTDDLKHDFHAVHHFTQQTLNIFRDAGVISNTRTSQVFIFSDNCAAQFKCYGIFTDLDTGYQQDVHRVYFGPEHGKGKLFFTILCCCHT
jgi:hypothetical protein